MQRVINCLGCSNALAAIWIPALLFLVHILAQARLFLGRELLLGTDLGLAHDVLAAALRAVLLPAVHGVR